MIDNPIPLEKQSEHLFLLMGTNPLPDWVATRLLLHEDGQLYLVHSDDVLPMAQRLSEYLMSSHGYRQPIFIRVPNPYIAMDVYDAVKEKLEEITQGTIGLNYTGGTKVMATHSHRAVTQEHQAGLPPIVFSYLEAATCAMRFDDGEKYLVGLAEKARISLTNLFKLHEEFLVNPPDQKPIAETVSDLLVKAHTRREGQRDWRANCDRLLRYPKDKSKCPPKKKPGDFKSEQELRQTRLKLDSQFAQVANTLYPNTDVGNITLGVIVDSKIWDFKTAKELAEWLDGKWLEHYVLKQIADRDSEYKVCYFGRNIEPRLPRSSSPGAQRDKFEADVAAMRGYQLHLLSCYTGSDKKICKMKLFEVFTRARQLGGDESRAALVCCSDDPRAVELEVGQIWDMKNRVKVFGRQDLKNLGDRFKDWFDSGAKE